MEHYRQRSLNSSFGGSLRTPPFLGETSGSGCSTVWRSFSRTRCGYKLLLSTAKVKAAIMSLNVSVLRGRGSRIRASEMLIEPEAWA
jgi:hypothetical protein